MEDKYNLSKIEEMTVKQCFDDNPTLSIVEISKLLNISSRTLYRLINKYKINREYASHFSYENRSINHLKKLGYKVEKV